MERNKFGFSLMELIVVIAIIGIITALSYPSVDKWYKIRRVHDSALAFASTVENVKAQAGKMRRPYVLGYADNNHFGVYTFSGQMAETHIQPNDYGGYRGGDKTSPWGGGTLSNPFSERIIMGRWTGQFSGIPVNTIVVMPNGSLRKFQDSDFSGVLEPLGDIMTVDFTDRLIAGGTNEDLKIVTHWQVVINPSGVVKVKRFDQQE